MEPLKAQVLHIKSTFEVYANASDQVYSKYLALAAEKLKISKTLLAAGLSIELRI